MGTETAQFDLRPWPKRVTTPNQNMTAAPLQDPGLMSPDS
jgi:hypothetical protein